MSIPTIFDLCDPREDVREGLISESDFAAAVAVKRTGDYVEWQATLWGDLGVDQIHEQAAEYWERFESAARASEASSRDAARETAR